MATRTERAAARKAGTGTISDAAVRRATGHGWAFWFDALDRFDVRARGHKAAAAHLGTARGCAAWWSQMIVVRYERERGLRALHQKADGFSASVSRTFGLPLADLFGRWATGRARARWLRGCRLRVRRSTPRRSMRITFLDGAGIQGAGDRPTSVEVNFSAKGPGRSVVAVQHNRLAGSADVAKSKRFWGGALDALRARAEPS